MNANPFSIRVVIYALPTFLIPCTKPSIWAQAPVEFIPDRNPGAKAMNIDEQICMRMPGSMLLVGNIVQAVD